MTIERSHGKARPTLPRSSDLVLPDTEPKRTEGRTPDGRFSAGNPIAKGARWKHAIRKCLGSSATEGEASSVQRDAFKVYLATLRSLPHDGPMVRSLVALHARHVALAAWATNRAADVGLDTEEGARLMAMANTHSQRAERTCVTALDVSSKLAAADAASASLTANPFLVPE